MDFRTIIDIPASPLRISHRSKMMMLGSCFSENIGNLLAGSVFDVNVNPFGILYNPESIAKVIERMLDKTLFKESELFFHNGLYHSFWHHGDFSSPTVDKSLAKMNGFLQKAVNDIQSIDVLFVTFGTAYVFKEKTTGQSVVNCHKLPASYFDRYMLDVADIVKNWRLLIEQLKILNPNLKILFTVSPIRHWKDGAHDNQLSKATLLLSIDKLQKMFEDVFYFPAYELLLDDLRDYRFYAEDMLHPNTTAINYIWKKFQDAFFSADTLSIINEWSKIKAAINHRPFNMESSQHKEFLRQTLLKLNLFTDKYPYLDCEIEKRLLRDQLEL